MKVNYPLDVLKQRRKQLCVRGEGLRRKNADYDFYNEVSKELDAVKDEIKEIDLAVSVLEIVKGW